MGLLVNLTDVKTYLQIGFTDDDALLNQLMTDISAQIESYCLRSFSMVAQYIDTDDGGKKEFILTKRPVVSILALTDLSARISQEQFATGNAIATSFPFNLKQAPAQSGNPGSVQIVVTPGGVVAFDDGNGNLTGTGIAGSSVLNYGSGIGLINFAAPPATGAAIKAAYNPISAIVDPSLYQIDSLAGLVRPLPEPPANFPIAGGMFDFIDGGAAIWGRGRQRWQIIFTAGFSAVPADVQLATLIAIAERYNRRDDLQSETAGDYQYQAAPGDSGLSVSVQQLLSRYKEIVI